MDVGMGAENILEIVFKVQCQCASMYIILAYIVQINDYRIWADSPHR